MSASETPDQATDYRVPALQRGLSILGMFSARERSLGMNDMAERLGVRQQTDSLYLYRALAPQRLAVNIPVGTRLPCHSTALGRVLLSGMSEAQLSALYQHIRLDDYPPPAPRTLPELQQLIAEDRQRGWVLHRSDYSTAIATGIRDHSGSIVAAINLSGPDAVMDTQVAQQGFLTSLLAASHDISQELGHTGSPSGL